MKRLWICLGAVMAVSFAVLGWIGTRIYQEAPPIPDRVVTGEGAVVLDRGDIAAGQNVWQAMGGMEVGSVWGHGSYVAPDWTADWLHREAVFILDAWSRAELGAGYEALNAEHKAQLEGRLVAMMRTNTYDPATGTLTIDPARARAFEANRAHYEDVFSNGNTGYAIPRGAVSDQAALRRLSAFFFWTAWAAAANRPNDHVSYTHNWPHERLVGNQPTGEAVVWTGVSIIMLLAGVSAMVWWYASRPDRQPEGPYPEEDPLGGWRSTPSQRATLKYFWVVSALILVQMLLGVVTAHYGVEGDGFYGIPLSRWLPYSVTRTWHIQIGLFWIATAWLAAGLFIGPLISGKDPPWQRLGVNVLFGALLLVVVGSLAGEWLSVQHKLTGAASFYLGHQGYEYVDLGRAWQIALFAGLLLWLVLVVRAILPALREPSEQRPLITLLLVSTGAIALFYGAGLAWGQHTNSAPATTSTSRAPPPSRSPGDRSSARWRSSRWCSWPTRPSVISGCPARLRGFRAIGGRSPSSSPSRSGTWWARACSAS
jgi:nitric oxide reductase subunit B